MDRYLPAAYKGHHFCKNFTKYSVPSLSFGWNMIFNMLHKWSWLFLVWNLVTQNRRRKGRVCRMLPFPLCITVHRLVTIPTAWGNFAHAHIVITNWLIAENPIIGRMCVDTEWSFSHIVITNWLIAENPIIGRMCVDTEWSFSVTVASSSGTRSIDARTRQQAKKSVPVQEKIISHIMNWTHNVTLHRLQKK